MIDVHRLRVPRVARVERFGVSESKAPSGVEAHGEEHGAGDYRAENRTAVHGGLAGARGSLRAALNESSVDAWAEPRSAPVRAEEIDGRSHGATRLAARCAALSPAGP